jgi:hypothetical protein
MPGSTVEHPGDLLAGSVRPKGQMPGAFLDILGYRPQQLVHLPALSQWHLAVKDRLQERMGEPQQLTVTLDEARVDVTGRAD